MSVLQWAPTGAQIVVQRTASTRGLVVSCWFLVVGLKDFDTSAGLSTGLAQCDKCPCNCILWNKMARVTNTLLPARMFLTCSAVSYGNWFQEGKGKDKYWLQGSSYVRNWKLYVVKWNGTEYCWRWRAYSSTINQNSHLRVMSSKTSFFETILLASHAIVLSNRMQF